ncbi:MAG: hypothetical protein A2284_14785 [Deltaproteobacteria bacterium RIFOXYA12_FULL_61_11]|nr:MAG: hypothetical protein A2284_14785 [Deltaproteobacteria bacterium RIFOXYA12_FULL_61_11]
MSATWPIVALGEVLTKSEAWIDLAPEVEYQEVTVHLWGRGVSQRRQVIGAEIGSDRRRQVRSRQFILSRIDARNGAFGLVPAELDGAVVSNDFPTFDVHENRMLPEYLGWLSRTATFVDACKAASEGTTNRVRLKEDKFLQMPLSLPPLSEQQRIVAKIERLAGLVDEAKRLRAKIELDHRRLLLSCFNQVVQGAGWRKMSGVAPLVRREVKIDPNVEYPELGIRSFGRGTFHKPALSGMEVGSKRLFQIAKGDLIFSNVFAWEGGIAVAQDQDDSRFGSHRFITCVPDPVVATSNFLCFYFLTMPGLLEIGEASPGGAGRNRTLGLNALSQIKVPVPDIRKQVWFDSVHAGLRAKEQMQQVADRGIDSIVPIVLQQVFNGAL